MARARRWVWLQLIIGWLPVWALYGMLIASAHPQAGLLSAALSSLHAIAVAAVLGLLVQRLTDRLPWPHPLRPRFVVAHAAAAVLYAAAWMGLTTLMQFFMYHGRILSLQYVQVGYLVLGMWLYVMVAGVSYATSATERAARAEAIAARSQLAALRSQLNPHFLFNALHTVVHLIPREPRRAAQAAEQVAGLLRATLGEDRDLVSVAEEWVFVERYLDIERIRFGDRLQVQADIAQEARNAVMPSFALQTLVENAVRHGVAPRVEPTRVLVSARVEQAMLRLTVADTGAGTQTATQNGGTGLQRLRDRLSVLYGTRARLDLTSGPAGFSARLDIPQEPA
ncbi:MAG TPA: histidine kinase [Gemmatimonadales bacterium]|nr:histidine kinase [Gemmatimonadales bacterium]